MEGDLYQLGLCENDGNMSVDGVSIDGVRTVAVPFPNSSRMTRDLSVLSLSALET